MCEATDDSSDNLEATAVGVETDSTPAPFRDSTKDTSAPPSLPVTAAPARSLVEHGGNPEESGDDTEPRAKKMKDKTTGRLSTQIAFLDVLSAHQKEAQQREFEHQQRMQLQLQEFQERREEARRRFDAEQRQKEEEARQRMEMERLEFQARMSQSSQTFQAQLLKQFSGDKDK